mgnify:CR=1 FL=1
MSRVFLRKRSKNYIVYLEYFDKETNKRKQKNMGSYPLKRDANKRLNEVKEEIYKQGAHNVELRLAQKKDGPVITENGNIILDAWFDNIDETLERRLKNITGVVETGLFIGYNVEIVAQ